MIWRHTPDITDAALCAKKLRHFVERAWPEIDPAPFVPNWHVDAVCDHLQACADGQIQRLIINVPPGTAKSMLCSVLYPAWRWATKPEWQLLSASYNAGLATRDAVKSRELMRGHWYTRWFRGPNSPFEGEPWEFSEDQDNKTFYKNTRYGHRISMGVGGPGTGYRGDCLAGNTLISTERGLVSIRELCAMPSPPKVWSVSRDGAAELATIKATSVRFARARTVDTISGSSITCTDGHRFYSGDSYVQSEDLRKGDALVRDVRNSVPRMSDPFCAPSIRGTEAQRPDVLLASMCDRQYQSPVRQGQDLPNLQGSCVQEQSSAVEFRGLLLDCLQAQENFSRAPSLVSLLSKRIPSAIVAAPTLFEGVRKQDTQSANGWIGQLTLQGGQQLRRMVSFDAPSYSRAGWLAVCELQETTSHKRNDLARQGNTPHESYNSSHQPQATRQSSRESSDAVQLVPHHSPQVETDSVALVGRLGDSFQPMYDIELDRNHNFFANSILVHNCLIIDDPLNAKEAHSEVKRDACIRWKDETMSSRFNVKEKAVEILIMQRLHENDLTGHLLRKGGWEHLVLPAEFETSRRSRTKVFDMSTGKPWEDQRKEEGELLFPTLLPKPVLEQLKKDLGSYAYAGQYQQRPVPAGGGILKREWFKRRWVLPGQDAVEGLECRPVPTQFDHISVWTDAAFKKTEDSDRVAIGVFGVKGVDLYLLHLVWDRMGFGDTVKALEHIRASWPQLSGIYIEDKANGSAIIETLRGKIAGVIAVEPEGGKEARIQAVAPFVEAGNLWLPLSAPWVEDYIVEACSFPKAPHDDAIDCTAYALTHYCAKRYSSILDALTRD